MVLFEIKRYPELFDWSELRSRKVSMRFTDMGVELRFRTEQRGTMLGLSSKRQSFEEELSRYRNWHDLRLKLAPSGASPNKQDSIADEGWACCTSSKATVVYFRQYVRGRAYIWRPTTKNNYCNYRSLSYLSLKLTNKNM